MKLKTERRKMWRRRTKKKRRITELLLGEVQGITEAENKTC